MKKLTYLFTFLLLVSSCALQKVYRGSSLIDFTKYEGFYMSQSSTVDFKYKPVGIVSSVILSGYEKSKPLTTKEAKERAKFERDKKLKEGNSYAPPPQNVNGYILYAATAQEAIDLLYSRAIEANADGILNIKIDYVPATPNQINSGYSATGMAIKR